MIELSGTDLVLYLKYLKMSAYLFLLLSVINCAIMIPIFATGHPLQGLPDNIDLSKVTVVNALGSDSKVWVAFVFVYVNSAAAYLMIYLFWRTTQRFSFYNYKSSTNFTKTDISLHTLLIRNIPRNIDPQLASAELLKVLQGTYFENILKVRVTGDYNDLQKEAK